MLEGEFPATAMPDPDWWQALWPQPGEVLARLGIEPATDAIDLCRGEGIFTIALASTARLVVAIDLGPDMVDLARARAAAAGVTNCTFAVGDTYGVADIGSARWTSSWSRTRFTAFPTRRGSRAPSRLL